MSKEKKILGRNSEGRMCLVNLRNRINEENDERIYGLGTSSIMCSLSVQEKGWSFILSVRKSLED